MELMSREMTGQTLWAVQERPVERQQYPKRAAHKARRGAGASKTLKGERVWDKEEGAHQRQLGAGEENGSVECLWCLLFGH